jgi:phosphate transport system protein
VLSADRFAPHGHRRVFDRELAEVRAGVLRMGGPVEASIELSIASLSGRNDIQATATVAAARAVDEARADLTTLIVRTIATQSPVASDLRLLMAMARIGYELDRIGEHAVGASRLAAALRPSLVPFDPGLAVIGARCGALLHAALCALVDLDAGAARTASLGDDEIDRAYDACLGRALARMGADPQCIDGGVHLILAARELERIGDRATKIAEELVTLATGHVQGLDP